MLAPTPAPTATSVREMDDVRDMVRSAAVTTIYVSRFLCRVAESRDSAERFKSSLRPFAHEPRTGRRRGSEKILEWRGDKSMIATMISATVD